MNVLIVGQGVWGRALYSLIEQNTKSVSFWKRGEPIVNTQVIVLAVPTESVRSVLGFVENNPEVLVINTTKGVESKTHLLPFEITRELLGEKVKYYSFLGPGFADEVMHKMPTLVNLGHFREENAEIIKQLFETEYFRVQATGSVEAIELAAAFKNIYAIVSGLAHGLGFGMNTRSQLITIALEEFYTLAEKLDYKIDKNALPAIIGDLILTCNSTQSRNFTFGKLLVEYSAVDAFKKVNSTVEGYTTVLSLDYFLKKADVELPLARFVSNVSRSTNHHNIRERFLEFIKRV